MDTQDRKPGRALLTLEEKSALEREGRLTLEKAAAYLDMAPKTLQNRLSAQRKNPEISAPKGHKGRRGWTFEIPELKAWDRRN